MKKVKMNTGGEPFMTLPFCSEHHSRAHRQARADERGGSCNYILPPSLACQLSSVRDIARRCAPYRG